MALSIVLCLSLLVPWGNLNQTQGKPLSAPSMSLATSLVSVHGSFGGSGGSCLTSLLRLSKLAKRESPLERSLSLWLLVLAISSLNNNSSHKQCLLFASL